MLSTDMVTYEDYLKYQNDMHDNDIEVFLNNLRKFLVEKFPEASSVKFILQEEEGYYRDSMMKKVNVLIGECSEDLKNYYKEKGPFTLYVRG